MYFGFKIQAPPLSVVVCFKLLLLLHWPVVAAVVVVVLLLLVLVGRSRLPKPPTNPLENILQCAAPKSCSVY